MNRRYGIGSGSNAVNVLSGFREEEERRRQRQAVKQQPENPPQQQGIATSSRVDQPAAQANTPGIQSVQSEPVEPVSTGQADSQERLRGIRTPQPSSAAQQPNAQPATPTSVTVNAESLSSAKATQQKVSKLKSKGDSGGLSPAEEKEFANLALEEQTNMYQISKTDPKAAAELINDSSIMDVDDAYNVREDDDGYWRVYNEQGQVSINKNTGEPVEFKTEEIEAALERGFDEPAVGAATPGQEAPSEDDIRRRVESHPKLAENDVDYGEVLALAEQAGLTPTEWLDKYAPDESGKRKSKKGKKKPLTRKQIERRLSADRGFVENDVDYGEVIALAERAGLTPEEWLDKYEGK